MKKGEIMPFAIKSKISASKMGHAVSIETREKQRMAHLYTTLTEETRKKQSISHKGRHSSLETREKCRLHMLRQWSDLDMRNKIIDGLRHRILPSGHGKHVSDALKGRCPSQACLDALKARRGEKRTRYEIQDRVEYSQLRREVWQRPSYVANQMKARLVKPNKAELLLEAILEKHFPGEWKFVGDGQFILAGLCPDFINVNGKKQIIELFGDYWHRGESPEYRVNKFKVFGFGCIVIWEHQLDHEEEVINQVRAYKWH